MKYWIVILLSMMSTLSFANGSTTIVPAIEQVEQAIFNQQKPLDFKSQQALKMSQDWIEKQQYPYQQGDAVTYLYEAGQATIVCAPMKLCLLKLQAGEKLMKGGVHLGDTARWMLQPTVGDHQHTYLVIKPVDVGLETNLALITNRRAYNLRLISREQDYMPMVAFHYQDQLAQEWEDYYAQVETVQAQNHFSDIGEYIEDLDFNYRIEGCSSCLWRPVRVYSNQAQTIIEMGEQLTQTDAPALMVLTKQGEQLVNYRIKQGKYIVDQVFQQAVLIVGVGNDQQKVVITNE